MADGDGTTQGAGVTDEWMALPDEGETLAMQSGRMVESDTSDTVEATYSGSTEDSDSVQPEVVTQNVDYELI